jgi:hypothetical protein
MSTQKSNNDNGRYFIFFVVDLKRVFECSLLLFQQTSIQYIYCFHILTILYWWKRFSVTRDTVSLSIILFLIVEGKTVCGTIVDSQELGTHFFLQCTHKPLLERTCLTNIFQSRFYQHVVYAQCNWMTNKVEIIRHEVLIYEQFMAENIVHITHE